MTMIRFSLIFILMIITAIDVSAENDLDSLLETSADQQAARSQHSMNENHADHKAIIQKAKSGSRLRIEEIVVTAQKREENLQDVPISVQAFSGEALDVRGISDPFDLQLATPGLVYSAVAGLSVIYLRGVGTDAFLPSTDASVANYIDGLYFPFLANLAQDFGSVERIEVLKGPQGTLFGRNSTGGAINVITKAPSEEFETRIFLDYTYSEPEAWRTKWYLNGALTETVSANLAVLFSDSDPIYTQVGQGPDTRGSKDKGLRVKVRWQPLQYFDMTLNSYFLEHEGAETAIQTSRQPNTLAETAGASPPPKDYTTESDIDAFNNADNHVFSLDAIYHARPFDFKSITGYQSLETDLLTDFDGSGAFIASYGANVFARIVTQEFQILSNEEGLFTELFGRNLEWILGSYYLRSLSGFRPVAFSASNTSAVISSLGLLGSLIPAELADASQVAALLRGDVNTRTYAFFTQSTLDITDWLAFTVGGRYQWEKRKVIGARSDIGAGGTAIANLFTFKDEHTITRNFSPRAVLDLKPDDNSLVYLSYAKGFKSGTYNTVVINTPPNYIKPEIVETWELGYKADLLNGGLRFNSAAFYTEARDLQVQFISLQSGGAVRLENAGSTEIDGLETEISWVPWSPLYLSLAGTWLRTSEYTSFPNGSGYDEETGLLISDDFSGNRSVRAPEYTANFTAVFTHDLFHGVLEVAADVYYNDGYYFDSQNATEQEVYTIINGRVSYLYEPWNLRLTAWGKNINDELWTYFRANADFGVTESLAPRRSYGVRLDWSY